MRTETIDGDRERRNAVGSEPLRTEKAILDFDERDSGG
jgi:hypothetical protein